MNDINLSNVASVATVEEKSPSVFDEVVNDYLDSGWTLVKICPHEKYHIAYLVKYKTEKKTI